MKDWFVENGIEFNHKLIQIQTNPYSVVALADLKVGTTLCVIPKDSILSVKNTAIADLLEQEQLGGMLALAVAVLYEFSIGMESPWFGYLHRLKGRENIPLFWSQEQARYLQGTDVGNALKKLKSDLLMDFNETVLPLVEKYPILDRTYFQFETFLNVTSVFFIYQVGYFESISGG
jgi:SET domain-containing protein 6